MSDYEGKACVAERESTPLESFTKRIETLSDRTREQRLRLESMGSRILGDSERPINPSTDRPDSEPGEYNTMNYAIDTLCNNVDALSETIEKLTCRL
jgi:hypothetical protein